MGIIEKSLKNIKQFGEKDYFPTLFYLVLLIAVSLTSFSLGMEYERAIYLQKHPIQRIENERLIEAWDQFMENREKDASYVASKNGKNYYSLSCRSASRIKEENRIYFSTEEEAERAGYKKARSCDWVKE